MQNTKERVKNICKGWRGVEFLLIATSLFMAYQLIWRGPGADGNNPRHVINGTNDLLTGTMSIPLKSPPFPLMDLFHGALAVVIGKKVKGVPVLNAVAFLLGCTSLALFTFILREYRKAGLDLTDRGALAFMAVHPLFIMSAGTTGDYIVSLTSLLGAWLCVLRGELAGGAALTGIAAGVRMTNCFWAIPLTFLAQRKWGTPRAAGYLLTAGLVGFLAYLGNLLPVHFRFWEWTNTYAGAMTWTDQIKTSLSKIVAFIGFSTLLITLATCRLDSYRASFQMMKKHIELPLALFLEYAAFTIFPEKFGYIISTLPLVAMILPQPPRPLFTYARLTLVFLMNFIVFDVQNKIPTKLHLCLGYYVAEYTCHDTKTVLEKLRFSLPRGPYYPIGDWAEDGRPTDRY